MEGEGRKGIQSSSGIIHIHHNNKKKIVCMYVCIAYATKIHVNRCVILTTNNIQYECRISSRLLILLDHEWCMGNNI